MSISIQRLSKGQNLPKNINQQETDFKKIENDISALAGRVSNLEISEYEGADKPNAKNGDQWVRIDPASNGGRLIAMMGLGFCILSAPKSQTARLRTQTSIGVI